MAGEAEKDTAQGDAPKAPSPRTKLSESERIADLRERLYSRGKTPELSERHTLTHHPRTEALASKQEIARGAIHDEIAATGMGRGPVRVVPLPVSTPREPVLPTIETLDRMTQKKRTRSYRIKLVLTGVVFFIGALLVSSGFLYFGNNTISGENISIEITGPLAIGGGEELTMQAVIANENAVPIEAATLIVNYPQGTQSAAEPGKELYTDRLQLNNIGSGEVINIPVKALVFGEENQEKIITAAVEYRVAGSNATFYKEATPLRIKISTSPIIMSVETVKSISSGQETDVTLTVQSNSPTELTDVLVKAVYPGGFDFDSATPEPVSGKDTWHIASLKPQEKKVIKIHAGVVGKEDEIRRIAFSAGVPNERDKFNLASILSTVSTDIVIEQPFIGVDVTINGETSATVAIDPKRAAEINVDFVNTLDDVIYDGVIHVELEGNALDEVVVSVTGGFYDSTKNTITWDSVDVPALKEIAPGRKGGVGFSIQPREDISETPEFSMTVTVQGQRVFEDRVPQQLVGTVERTIKITSIAKLASSALYSEGPFVNTGPTPPVAETETKYTLLFTADAGTNALTGGEMTAILPQYMDWLDLVSEDDTVTYSAVNRTLTWSVGTMDANAHKEAWVQVSFLPSLTQVGKTPILLETQRFKATDRFTGTVIRTEAPALTTELFNDPDSTTHDGRVQAP
jgi:hypothetical protein